MVLNQSYNSIFPDFSSKCQFCLTQNKIPWHFPDLEEFFFLTISWPVATMNLSFFQTNVFPVVIFISMDKGHNSRVGLELL